MPEKTPTRLNPDDRARWRHHLATGPFRGPFESKMAEAIIALDDEVTRLTELIGTPQTDDYFEAVKLEAAHQVERWGTEHDSGKEPADWFWLLGYLAGKALHDIRGKRAHHIIATAAALLNWHRAVTGESTAMRPGIEPPTPAPGFSAGLGMKVCTHDGVTPSDSVVANRRLNGDTP